MEKLFSKKKSSITFKHIFILYFRSSLIILFFPLLCIFFVVNNNNQKIKNEAVNSVLTMLKQSKSTINANITYTQNISQQFCVDDSFSSIINRNQSGLNPYNYWLAQKKVLYYKSLNNIIYKATIILRDEVLITDDIVTSNMQDYYDRNLNFSNTTYEQWYDSLWEPSNSNRFSKPILITNMWGQKEKVVVYYRFLSTNSGFDRNTVLMILVKESSFTDFLQNFNLEGGWACVVEPGGNIVASIPKDKSFADDLSLMKEGTFSKYTNKSIFVNVESPENGWRYAAVYPTQYVQTNVLFTIISTISITILTVLAALFFALLFSQREAKNMQRIASTVSNFNDQIAEKNVFNYIFNSINILVQQNKNLEYTLKKNMPYFESACFEKLFKGGFDTLDEINNAFSLFHIEFYDDAYLAVVLRLNGFGHQYSPEIVTQINYAKQILNEYIQREMMGKTYRHEVDFDKVSLVLLFDNHTDWKAESKILVQNILNYAQSQGIDINVGLGNTYNSPTEIFRSYSEAMEVLKYKSLNAKTNIINFSDIPKQDDLYYYPMEIEMKLINLVKNGKTHELTQMLNVLYNENVETRSLTKEVFHYFVNEIYGTILKMLPNDKNIEEETKSEIYTQLQSDASKQQVWDKIQTTFILSCEEANKRKANKSIQLKKQIEEYISHEYSSCQFSIISVATCFKMNDSYFSRIFKDLFESTFSEYVEMVRLKNAKELLSTSKMTIEEVAIAVGYTSAHVFRRAFKRVYGILPTGVRE